MLKTIIKKILKEHMLDPDKLSRFKKQYVDTSKTWSNDPHTKNNLITDIHVEYGYIYKKDYYFHEIPGYPDRIDIRLFKA